MKWQKIFIVVAVIMLMPVVMVLAEDFPWPGVEEPVRVSPDQEAKRPSLALAQDKVAVAWYGTTAHPGVYLSEWTGAWSAAAPVTTITTSAESKFPSLAYSGTEQLSIAWLQGPGPNSPNAVLQQDVGEGAAKTVITSVYGEAAPYLAVGVDAMHLVFAGAALQENATKGDLYYASRFLNQATWGTPTLVVTRAQVMPQDVGGIWYPRLALTDAGQQIHIVWEQTTETISRTVWYISGQRQGGGVTWQAPFQVSPVGQMAVRPSIVTGDDDQVHIAWSEIAEGTESKPVEQYINYRRVSDGTWSAPTRIDPEPVKVNTLFPTKSSPQVAVCGTQVCVAWHGFRSDQSNKEEISVRCSKNGGLSWRSTFNVSESSDALSLFPALQVDSSKQVHVAWQDITVGPVVYKGAFYRMGTLDFKVFLPLVVRNRS